MAERHPVVWLVVFKTRLSVWTSFKQERQTHGKSLNSGSYTQGLIRPHVAIKYENKSQEEKLFIYMFHISSHLKWRKNSSSIMMMMTYEVLVKSGYSKASDSVSRSFINLRKILDWKEEVKSKWHVHGFSNWSYNRTGLIRRFGIF